MFREPETYPVLPQTIKNFLREVNGVVLPKFISEENKITILSDIQAVQVGEDKVIAYYSCIGSPWVDAVYDAWIQVGKIESPQIESIAINLIKSPKWWRIQ